MKIHKVDNSLRNLGKAVLWQYDRAKRLLSIMKYAQVMFYCAVSQFWDFWANKVLSIDTCGAFGCSVWGIFLGMPRPTVEENGERRLIATVVYRRLLKGAFFLMKTGVSFDDILGYLEIIYGIGGEDSLSKWSVQVPYGWSTNIDELNADPQKEEGYFPRLAYKSNAVFHHKTSEDIEEGNWKCIRDITAAENTSFQHLLDEGLIVSTEEPADVRDKENFLILKLYDPQHICRKIASAPRNALSITASYRIGEKVITAVATRRQKCGVRLIDNGDMSISYEKSEYFDEMHKDQRLLFQQRFDEFCPFPLGIKSNEPVEHYVFGFGEERNPYGEEWEYKEGTAYENWPYESETTDKNSFYVDEQKEYEKLMREGAICVVQFTAKILRFWHSLFQIAPGIAEAADPKTDPYFYCTILGRGKTAAEAISAARSEGHEIDDDIPTYEYGIPFNEGDIAIIDFSECAASEKWRDRPLFGMVATENGITAEQNPFFYKIMWQVIWKRYYGAKQTNVQYKVGIAYPKGAVIGYESAEYEALNWIATEDITSEENTSFQAISAKLKMTLKGGPFVGSIGSGKKPYTSRRFALCETMESFLNPHKGMTKIAKGRIAEGKDANGMYKLYRNTSGGDLIVFYSTKEEWAEEVPKYYDAIWLAEPTDENIENAISQLCRRNNCPVVRYTDAIRFMADTQYYKGEVVVSGGEERIAAMDGKWSDEKTFITGSFPQSKSVLHKHYPYANDVFSQGGYFSPQYDQLRNSYKELLVDWDGHYFSPHPWSKDRI